MKILQLKSENVKRLSAVEITPDGNLVVIGGRNGQGKSSVLDSIMYALAGGSTLPAKPLRNGESKGQVVVDLGDMIVTRKFARKPDGEVTTALEIKRPNGDKAGSPQKILDDLCGRMAFDPLEFSRLKPKQQLDSLRELVGLDFAELDRERQKLFDDRASLNRQAKAKAAELAACPKVADAPAVEQSAVDLTQELERRIATNEHNANERRVLADHRRQNDQLLKTATAADERVAELRKQLAEEESRAAQWRKQYNEGVEAFKKHEASVAELTDANCEEVREQIKGAEAVNRNVRQNQQHTKLAAAVSDLESDAESLSERIKAIDDNKAAKMAAAPFPVPSLGFDAGGITFNGLPFDQASSAEQLRVSVAMGLALNPKLRVMLIRDGSLLDSDALALVAEMATAADAQIWLERVGIGEETSVVIEDGHVAAVAEESMVTA